MMMSKRDEDEPTVEQAAGLLRDALDLTTGVFDELLPAIKRSRRDAVDEVAAVTDRVACAWADLTVAVATLLELERVPA